MISNFAAGSPDIETAQARTGAYSGAESETASEAGALFALLLAPESVSDPAAEAAAGALAHAGSQAPRQDSPLLIALQAGTPGGNGLPAGGATLPSAGAVLAAVTNADSGMATGADGDSADESLARMLGMVRALHGLPALAGDEPPGGAFRLAAQASAVNIETRAEAQGQLLAATAAAPTVAASQGGATHAANPSPSLPIPMPPNQPGWGEAVGQRVLWMVSAKSQHAQLRLNPPELGPVEVRVRMDDDGLKLSFASGHAGVREALEAAAPRLRELFQAEGLQLEQMDIGERHAAGEEREQAGEGGTAEGDVADGVAEDDGRPAGAAAAGAGLVDVFV